jgi:hypothetical protein
MLEPGSRFLRPKRRQRELFGGAGLKCLLLKGGGERLHRGGSGGDQLVCILLGRNNVF